MLHIVRAASPQDLSQRVDEFVKSSERLGRSVRSDERASGASTSWVLSDLRSKFEIQQKLLDLYGYYSDEQVLRASDFWKMLLRRARPQIQIVSRDFAKVLVRAFLEEQREALGGKKYSENAVLAAMEKFAGIIYHPRGFELIEEWFESHPESRESWGDDFLLARLLLNYFSSKNWALSKWLPAILLSVDELGDLWSQPMIVDLGAELTGSEAQLFQRLSQTCEVTIIEPAPAWRKKEEPVLAPYRDLEGFAAAKPVTLAHATGQGISAPQALRFASPLSEVQKTVGLVRTWLDAGVPPQEIAFLAPDAEEYWPSLQSYLATEGIPVNKASSRRLSHMVSIQKWLSRLKACGGEMRFSDIENIYYSSPGRAKLRFEHFQSLLANYYDLEDVQRHEEVARIFDAPHDFTERMTRDAFLSACLGLWGLDDEIEPFVQWTREILKNASPRTEFSLKDWTDYAQAVLVNIEKTVTPADHEGVFVDNFQSSRASGFSHRIFLGLSDEALRRSEPQALPLTDIAGLSQIGFYLSHPDISIRDFELRWLLDEPSTKTILSFSQTGWDGSVNTPSLLWIEKSQGAEPLDVRDVESRWGLLKNGRWNEWRESAGWSPARAERTRERLLRDLGELEDRPPFQAEVSQLSPSSIEKYLDCPFVFAAQKVFNLKDLEQRDLDLARTDLGLLTHALFQELMDRGWTAREVFEDELIALIDEEKEKMHFQVAEPKWWPALRKKLVGTLRRFLDVEKEWQKQFAALKNVWHEKEWEIYFDPRTGEFSTAESTTDPSAVLAIRGRIDRIEESSEGHYVVVDYKSSSYGLNNHPDWFDKNNLQLLFYMWALERGAVKDLPPKPVIGAFYYVFKDFSRTIGLQIDEHAGFLFPPPSRKIKRTASEDDKRELFVRLEETIRGAVQRMKRQEWAPVPIDEEICVECNWRVLCRASHL